MSNDLIAAREDQTEWYTGLGIAESIADISSGVESENWVEAGIGIVATAGEAAAWATDPFGQLIQYGVSWLMEHLQPLRDALDWLAGDPPQIEAYAQTWRNVSTAVAATATTLRDRSQADTTSWQGAAANTYRSHATALAQAITDTAKTAELISLVVSVAGMLVASVRELVRDMIAELVAILIERAWLWAAETATVVGAPAAEAQIQALVAKWVGKVARVIAKLIRSLNNLDGLTKKLDELWELIRQALRRLGKEDVEEPNPEAKNPIAAPNQKSPTTKSSPDGTTSSAESPSGPTSSTPTTPEGTTTKPSGTGSPSGDASRAPTQPSGTASPSGDGAPTASGTGSGNKPPGERPPAGAARPDQPDPNVPGPAGRKILQPAHPRHHLDRIRPNSRTRGRNTVILPSHRDQIVADIADIQAGRAHWNPNTSRYEINGRVYGVEENGTVFPESGPGFVQLDRNEYEMLKKIIEHDGDVDAAQQAVHRNPRFANDEAWERVAQLYRDHHRGGSQ
jgi:hypothetical protein